MDRTCFHCQNSPSFGDAVKRLHRVRIWCTQLQNGRTSITVIAPVGPAAIKNVYDYCTSEGNDFGKPTSH